MKRVRWTCPNGCAAVLGSTRPRADDVVRYCLACSAKAGRLVRREAPTLDAKRAKREAAAKARAAARREREAARDAARYTIGGVDVRDLVRQAWALPTSRHWRAKRRLNASPPTLTLRRSDQSRYLGRAFMHEHRIMLTVRSMNTSGLDLVSTLLHEVAHLLIGSYDAAGRRRPHRPAFYDCHAALVRDWHEATAPTVDVAAAPATEPA